MFLAHPRQSVCCRGVLGTGGQGGEPFACRLLPWVSLVANGASGWRMVDQKARATHSAIGATARPQIGAVVESWTAKDAIRRQLPSRCSKNHSRLRGCRVIQSNR